MTNKKYTPITYEHPDYRDFYDDYPTPYEINKAKFEAEQKEYWRLKDAGVVIPEVDEIKEKYLDDVKKAREKASKAATFKALGYKISAKMRLAYYRMTDLCKAYSVYSMDSSWVCTKDFAVWAKSKYLNPDELTFVTNIRDPFNTVFDPEQCAFVPKSLAKLLKYESPHVLLSSRGYSLENLPKFIDVRGDNAAKPRIRVRLSPYLGVKLNACFSTLDEAQKALYSTRAKQIRMYLGTTRDMRIKNALAQHIDKLEQLSGVYNHVF